MKLIAHILVLNVVWLIFTNVCFLQEKVELPLKTKQKKVFG